MKSDINSYFDHFTLKDYAAKDYCQKSLELFDGDGILERQFTENRAVIINEMLMMDTINKTEEEGDDRRILEDRRMLDDLSFDTCTGDKCF